MLNAGLRSGVKLFKQMMRLNFISSNIYIIVEAYLYPDNSIPASELHAPRSQHTAPIVKSAVYKYACSLTYLLTDVLIQKTCW